MPDTLGIVVAALGGAAVGIERQQSGHATGVNARFGGMRTFTLLGALAGVAGWLTTLQYVALAAVLVAGAVAVVVAGYVAASTREIDATTEAAALVVIAAGVIAGLGWLALASGIVAITTLLLVEKSRLHSMVGRIDDEELQAAVRFGVMAVVILPLLPEGPYGPWGGVRPRELWLLVLFFSGLSFTGYLARRLMGAGQGYPLAGLIGGLISSTNVTYTFARLSRSDQSLAQPLALGAIGACTVLFPRVLVAASVLNVDVARALLPYIVAPFAAGVAILALSWKKGDAGDGSNDRPSNPLQIVPALQMAVLFQVVLFLVAASRQYLGQRGLPVTGAVLGLTDVDALTISMTRVGAATYGSAAAARAIAIGIAANTFLKLAVAMVLGTSRFRRLALAGIGAMWVALGMALIAVG